MFCLHCLLKVALGVILFVNPALVFYDIFTDLCPVNAVVQTKVSYYWRLKYSIYHQTSDDNFKNTKAR